MKFFAIVVMPQQCYCYTCVFNMLHYIYTYIFRNNWSFLFAIGIESKAERSVYNESCNEREDRWHCYLVTFCLL